MRVFLILFFVKMHRGLAIGPVITPKRESNGMRARSFILCFVVLILFCGCGGGGGSSSSVPITTTNPETTPETEYISFFAYNFVNGSYYPVNASKVAEGDHCYIYLQENQAVDQDAIDRVKDEFDTNIYHKVRNAFGSEPYRGIDNDPKLYILLLNVQDDFSSDSPSYIAGYFDPGNEYVTTHSNKKEMFFMNINPAPGIVVGDADFNDTLAHEFQHMIHWEQKTHQREVDDATWLDEAMSTIAGTYCGYGPSWYSVWIYEKDPSNSLTLWDYKAEDYGVVYMWAQYFKDRFGDNIFEKMMNQDFTGITSVNNALLAEEYSKEFDFDTTFRDLSIAVFSGTKQWYGHPEWSYTSSINAALDYGLLPLGNVTLSSLEAYSMNFYQSSVTSPSDHTVIWTQANANNYASFVSDDIPNITFTMDSEAPYGYTENGYLIEQQLEGSSGGGEVVNSSVVQNTAKLAVVEISASLATRVSKSPRQILSEANESPVVKRLFAQKGKKCRVHMDSFFRERERELRKSGARPSF
jgi:hypothetical protein